MEMKVVDLFCGIGGLSYGFKGEGFRVIAGLDSDPTCKFAFEANIKGKFISADIRDVSGAQINRLFGDGQRGYRVLIGCAPCTPFTLYTGRYRRAKRKDDRWQLLKEFARLVKLTRPDVVSMENVPRLASHAVFLAFVKGLQEGGYRVTWRKVRADHYGVPQRRSRLVLLASRWGEIQMPKPTHREKPATVRDAIGSLPKIEPGKPCPTDKLHVSRNLSTTNIARLKSTKEGGSWKDWDAELQLECHRKKGGESFRSVYGRMRWDTPSPVITTQCLGIGNGRFGHPVQDRAISIREAALLQSFPQDFRFIANSDQVNTTALARQIGNAVPVKLGSVIAQTIRAHLASLPAKRHRKPTRAQSRH